MRKLKLLALFAGLMFSVGMWAGGSCGGGLTWNYDSYTKTLTISYDGSGTGVMDDYTTSSPKAPWSFYQDYMTTIVLPEGLTHIGDCAFYGCSLVTSFSIPSTVTSIGNKAIWIYNLETLPLPSGLTSIGDRAFDGCTKLSSLTIPASVTSIGEEITLSCSSLTSIVVAEGNALYDSRDNCNAIIRKSDDALIAGCKTSSIPSSVEIIAKGAFHGQRYMSYVYLPYGLKRIEDNAFVATDIHQIDIPATVNYIHDGAFQPDSLSSIDVNENNTTYECPAYCNVIIEKATHKLILGCKYSQIPSGVTEIGTGAFYSVKDLESIDIPASVTTIGSSAFLGTGLTSLTLHAGITYLGVMSFYNCTHLQKIYSLSPTPPVCQLASVFTNVDKSIPVYVPAGSIPTYQSKTGWSEFTNYKEIGTEPLQWENDSCIVTLNAGVMTVTPLPNKMGHMSGTELIPQPWNPFCKYVTSIVLEDGVVNVAANCFDGCSNATSVRMSNDLYNIGVNAFRGCSSLTSIVIPDKIINIFKHAFQGCTSLADVYFYTSSSKWFISEYNPVDWTTEASLDFKSAKATKCHVFADRLATERAAWGAGGSMGELNLTFVGDLDNILIKDNSESLGTIDEFLAGHNGQFVEELSISRPVYCNTYYNTLCLPFSMNASQIAASSIAGATIKKFTGASVENDVLHLTLSEVNTIEKGKPYFISYSNADALSKLDFKGVQIDASEPAGVTYNGVTFQGTYHGFNMPAGHDYLFLGQNNTLYWPSVAGAIKPFRAYFIISTNSGAPIRRGMLAVFDDANAPAVVTAIENAESDVQSTKIMENGQMIIIRNGVKYNAAGQIVK